jgi:hypothetical protein
VLLDRFNSICDWARGLIADSFRERKALDAAPDGDAARGERAFSEPAHTHSLAYTHTGCFSRRVERPECVTHRNIDRAGAGVARRWYTRESERRPPSQAPRANIRNIISRRPAHCLLLRQPQSLAQHQTEVFAHMSSSTECQKFNSNRCKKSNY